MRGVLLHYCIGIDSPTDEEYITLCRLAFGLHIMQCIIPT